MFYIDKVFENVYKIWITALFMALIIKSNIRKTIKNLDRENSISSVAEEVELAMERRIEEILIDAIKRAKANKRRTLQARDL